MQNLRFIVIAVVISLFLLSERVISSVMQEINKQIDQLQVGSSSFEDAVRIFGEPTQYLWSNKTFQKDNRPEVFIAVWKDRLNILISHGVIYEIRVESPRPKYLFESAYSTADGGRIINPKRFVELVKGAEVR